jgi:hypothetical protein
MRKLGARKQQEFNVSRAKSNAFFLVTSRRETLCSPLASHFPILREKTVTKTIRPAGLIGCVLGIGAFVLSIAPPVRAALIITLQVNSNTISITDGGPFDMDATTGQINVSTNLLNTTLAADGAPYQFSSLSATSNQSLGTAGSDAMITVSGAILNNSTNPLPVPIGIQVSDVNFTFPATPQSISSGAADTMAFTSSGDSRTFQSFYDPTNSGIPGGISTPPIIFAAPTGAGPFAFSKTNSQSIQTPVLPYALVNQTTITLVPGPSPGDVATDNFSGITIVAVPEPAALALVSMGMGVALLRIRRRRPTA